MKKYLWFLIAALFVMAIFAVVGCKPAGVPEASPSPTPTKTPTPATPAPDTACPAVKSTAISSIYDQETVTFYVYDPESGIIWPISYTLSAYVGKLTITFDEPITSNCIEDPANWSIYVTRGDTKLGPFTPYDISLSADGKKITLLFEPCQDVLYKIQYSYVEWGSTEVKQGYVEVDGEFCGIICDPNDIKRYKDPFGETGVEALLEDLGIDVNVISYSIATDPPAPEYADLIEWTLKGCVVCDDLGNCCCDFCGSACCIEPVCSPVPGCPIGTPVPGQPCVPTCP